MSNGLINTFTDYGDTSSIGSGSTTTSGGGKEKKTGSSLDAGKIGMIGSIINTAGGLISGFNYKAQENQIEMARLQAEAANAQVNAQANENKKKYLMYGIGAVVLVVIILVLKRR